MLIIIKKILMKNLEKVFFSGLVKCYVLGSCFNYGCRVLFFFIFYYVIVDIYKRMYGMFSYILKYNKINIVNLYLIKELEY